MRYLIDFSYSGENFNGYQKQPFLRTVQKEIEDVLKMINQKDVKIFSAGRTDAKVSALHQMAHFDLDKDIKPYKLKGALNGYLPPDIYINDVKIVDDDFHARYMAKSKTYRYTINTGVYNPILRNVIYQYCKPLDVSEMRNAIKYFIGTHDFTTFSCAEDKRENKTRTIFDAKVESNDSLITITFKGSGFLKYQVRNMVGILIDIGNRKTEPCIIPKLIDKKDRKEAKATAPAEGLSLIDVSYN